MNTFKPSKKPLNNEKIVVSIRMDINKIEEIDKMAAKIDISRNEFINQCIKFALSNIEFNDKDNKKK